MDSILNIINNPSVVKEFGDEQLKALAILMGEDKTKRDTYNKINYILKTELKSRSKERSKAKSEEPIEITGINKSNTVRFNSGNIHRGEYGQLEGTRSLIVYINDRSEVDDAITVRTSSYLKLPKLGDGVEIYGGLAVTYEELKSIGLGEWCYLISDLKSKIDSKFKNYSKEKRQFTIEIIERFLESQGISWRAQKVKRDDLEYILRRGDKTLGTVEIGPLGRLTVLPIQSSTLKDEYLKVNIVLLKQLGVYDDGLILALNDIIDGVFPVSNYGVSVDKTGRINKPSAEEIRSVEKKGTIHYNNKVSALIKGTGSVQRGVAVVKKKDTVKIILPYNTKEGSNQELLKIH